MLTMCKIILPILSLLAITWGVTGVLAGDRWSWAAVAAGSVVLAACGIATMARHWPDLDRITCLDETNQDKRRKGTPRSMLSL